MGGDEAWATSRPGRRCREAVILTRIRLINLWRDSLDETKPLPFVRSTDRIDKR
jgi:hypothetical protein